MRDKFEAPDNFIPVTRDYGKTASALKQTVTSKGQPATGTSSNIPGFVIHEYDQPRPPSDKGQRQNAKPPTVEDVPENPSGPSTEGYFDKQKPKPAAANRPEDSLNLPGVQNLTPKPDNIFGGFYVFAWLNSHPTATLSPPLFASPLERTQSSRNRSSSSPNGAREDPPTPKANPEIQWRVDEQDIRDDLREVDDFLKSRSSVSDRIVYQECALGTRDAIVEQLTRVKTKLMSAEKVNPEKLKILGTKEAIAAAADQIFQFFLPIKFDGPTVQKYWGAIDSLILVTISNQTIYGAIANSLNSPISHRRLKHRRAILSITRAGNSIPKKGERGISVVTMTRFHTSPSFSVKLPGRFSHSRNFTRRHSPRIDSTYTYQKSSQKLGCIF